MSLVSSHQIKPLTSPVNTTGPVDANLVRGNDNTVRNAYVAHDADATIHFQSSALAARPAAGVAGRKWMTEDAGVARLWYDTGAGWVELTIASNVVGPASATDNGIVRFDGTTGKLVQDSSVTLTPSGLSDWTMATPSDGALTVSATNGLMTLIGRGITLKAGAINALVIRDATDSVDLLKADSDITISTLAGSGTRMVTATAAGLLGAAAIPTGDVVGPASATDNAVARFDLTTGKLIQDSAVTIADTGATTIAAGSATPALTVTTTGASQLRLAYNASNFAVVNVSSTGAVSLNATGTGSSFTFLDRLASNLAASANYTADFGSTISSGTSSALAIRGTANNQTTTGTVGFIRGVTGVASSQGVGATTLEASALHAEVSSSNGTIVNGHGLYVSTINSAMTNAHGIRVLDVTGGTSQNYAIYTGLGTVRFGDAVTVTAGGIAVTGDSTITGTLGGITTLTTSTAINPSANDVVTLGSSGNGFRSLQIQHASNRATGIQLVQGAVSTPSPRIMFGNTNTPSNTNVIYQGTADVLNFTTGGTVGSSSGTVRWAYNTTALYPTTTNAYALGISTSVWSIVHATTFASTSGYSVAGTQVVGAQGATITDPTGGTVQDSEARTAIIAIIDRLQAHGLIA